MTFDLLNEWLWTWDAELKNSVPPSLSSCRPGVSVNGILEFGKWPERIEPQLPLVQIYISLDNKTSAHYIRTSSKDQRCSSTKDSSLCGSRVQNLCWTLSQGSDVLQAGWKPLSNLTVSAWSTCCRLILIGRWNHFRRYCNGHVGACSCVIHSTTAPMAARYIAMHADLLLRSVHVYLILNKTATSTSTRARSAALLGPSDACP